MLRKSWQNSVLDKSVTTRFRKLGMLGEYVAAELLIVAGFSNIINLNKEKQNSEHFDLLAQRDNCSYAISVKARNKFENNGRLNSRYKLANDPEQFESVAVNRHRAIPAWITIAFDFEDATFDAYFGRLCDLSGNRKGISMLPHATHKYEPLAKQISVFDFGVTLEEVQLLKNKYTSR